MHLHYLANARLPTEKAHGLQIMQNCEAFAAHLPTTLYPARRAQTKLRGVDPFDFYAVPGTFAVQYIPCLDLFPLLRGRENALSRPIFYVQWATYTLVLLARLARVKADEAIFYSRDIKTLMALRRIKPGRRLFWEVHSLSPSASIRAVQAAQAQALGGVITVTGHLADRLADLGVPRAKLHVAPDGFRAARFADAPTQAEARAALNLPPEAFIVGYLGRLHTLNMSKGVDDLIRAVAQAVGLSETRGQTVGLSPLPKATGRDIHLLLVGGPDDHIPPLRAMWRELGLPAAHFHATGQIAAQDVPRALAAFDVAAMPFPWTEHFAYYASAIKLFEYMASGRAILATDLPSTAEIVQDGETALLVPPSDVDALAAGLARLYDDPALRARLGAAARELVFARYTWAARAQGILNFIGQQARA